MNRRALLIVNDKSRQGGTDLDAALEVFRRGGVEVFLRQGDGPEEVDRLIRKNACRADLVILAGGDGTLHRGAGALLDSGLPFGILPLGTANDLARTLQIPLDLEGAANAIVAGRQREIDLAQANGQLFFNVAHLSVGVHLQNAVSPEMKQPWGSLSYLRALAQTLGDRRSFQVTARHDGGVQSFRSIQVAIGNGRCYGGGMTIAEDAEIDDAFLHLYSIAPLGFWRLCRLVSPLRPGMAKEPAAVRVLRTSQVTLETDHRMPVSADGELITYTPVEFTVLPNALTVYAPNQKETP